MRRRRNVADRDKQQQPSVRQRQGFLDRRDARRVQAFGYLGRIGAGARDGRRIDRTERG